MNLLSLDENDARSLKTWKLVFGLWHFRHILMKALCKHFWLDDKPVGSLHWASVVGHRPTDQKCKDFARGRQNLREHLYALMHCGMLSLCNAGTAGNLLSHVLMVRCAIYLR
jgi:hypothetical protein